MDPLGPDADLVSAGLDLSEGNPLDIGRLHPKIPDRPECRPFQMESPAIVRRPLKTVSEFQHDRDALSSVSFGSEVDSLRSEVEAFVDPTESLTTRPDVSPYRGT